MTRDGPRLFLYATSGEAPSEAERVARELLEAEEVSGDVRITRWHPDAEGWLDDSVPLSIGAPTNERAEEVAARVRAMAPAGTEVKVGATELQHPLFVLFGTALDRFP